MKITTAMNHRDRFKSQVNGAYYWCRHSGWLHEKLLTQLREKVYEDPAWNKVPGWVRRDIYNLTDHLSRGLYFPNLTQRELNHLLAKARAGEETKPVAYLRWALRVDGVEVTSDEIIKRREAGDEDIWKRVEGAHVWNHKPDHTFSGWTNTYDHKKPVKQ